MKSMVDQWRVTGTVRVPTYGAPAVDAMRTRISRGLAARTRDAQAVLPPASSAKPSWRNEMPE